MKTSSCLVRATLISAVVYFLVGGLWYSPLLFQAPWMSMVGLTPEAQRQAGPACLVIGFLAALVLAAGTGIFLRSAGVRSARAGIAHGIALWAAFIATTLTATFYEHRPAELYFIQAGFGLVGLIVIGALQGYFAGRAPSPSSLGAVEPGALSAT